MRLWYVTDLPWVFWQAADFGRVRLRGRVLDRARGRWLSCFYLGERGGLCCIPSHDGFRRSLARGPAWTAHGERAAVDHGLALIVSPDDGQSLLLVDAGTWGGSAGRGTSST